MAPARRSTPAMSATPFVLEHRAVTPDVGSWAPRRRRPRGPRRPRRAVVGHRDHRGDGLVGQRLLGGDARMALAAFDVAVAVVTFIANRAPSRSAVPRRRRAPGLRRVGGCAVGRSLPGRDRSMRRPAGGLEYVRAEPGLLTFTVPCLPCGASKDLERGLARKGDGWRAACQ